MKNQLKILFICLVPLLYSCKAFAALCYQGKVHFVFPTLQFIWPILFATLLPLALLEAFIIKKDFSYLPLGRIFGYRLLCKSFSTIIVFPLTWLLLTLLLYCILEITHFKSIHYFLDPIITVMLSSLWMFTTNDEWSAPIAGLIQLLPFFLTSTWAEGLVINKFIIPSERDEMKIGTSKVNNISFIILYLIMFGCLAVVLLSCR